MTSTLISNMFEVKLNLKSIANSLGKTITDIANDTGLNRNTITALYHNKVDGIKFETVEKICSTYNLDFEDLFVVTDDRKGEYDGYLTEKREMCPFYVWMWFINVKKLPKDWFGGNDFGKMKVYFKRNQSQLFSYYPEVKEMADYFIERYSKSSELKKLLSEINIREDNVFEIYSDVYNGKIDSYNTSQLLNYFEKIIEGFLDYSSHVSFMHSIDYGADRKKIEQFATKLNMNARDVLTLTKPMNPLFNHRKFMLEFEMVKKIKVKKVSKNDLNRYLDRLVDSDPMYQSYRDKFNYYYHNFSGGRDIDPVRVKEKLVYFYDNYDFFSKKYNIYKKYQQTRKKQIEKTLKKYKIEANPFEIYLTLAELRERRKSYNMMAIYVLDKILDKIEDLTGLQKEYLKFLSYDEVGNALKGLINNETLQNRYESSILLMLDEGTYKVLEGTNAEEMRNELEAKVISLESRTHFSGSIINQGYARGIATSINDNLSKITDNVLILDSYSEEIDDKILASVGVIATKNITNPKFLKLLDLYYIPAVYSPEIKSWAEKGDVVEVRGNHGTVRIIFKK